MVVIADLQANDAGAVYREAAADRTLRAVDVLIELGRLLDQLAVRGVHDQVSLSVELHAGRASELEVDCARIGPGVDDPVVFERAGVRMEREVDAGIDIGHLDAAVARHTRSGIGEIAGVGVGDAELLVELHDRRIGICTERSDLQNVAAADELDRAAILHHVKCVVPIRGGECDRAVGLTLVGLKDDLLEVGDSRARRVRTLRCDYGRRRGSTLRRQRRLRIHLGGLSPDGRSRRRARRRLDVRRGGCSTRQVEQLELISTGRVGNALNAERVIAGDEVERGARRLAHRIGRGG